MEVTKITRREAFKANTEERVKTADRILDLMADGQEWCVSALCHRLGLRETSVRPRVSELKSEGIIKAVDVTNQYGIREAIYKLRKDDESA